MNLWIRQRGEVLEIVVDGRIRGRLRGVTPALADIATPAAVADFLLKHARLIKHCDEPDPESENEET